MSRVRTVAAALILLALTPIGARADTLLIPFVGVNYGGDSGKDVSDAVDARRFNGGMSLTFMGGGVFGVEGDFGYSPDFYGKTDTGGSSILTATANLVVGLPFGGQHGFGVRPYAVGGVGMLKSSADFSQAASIDDNSVTWSAGGGLMVFFTTRVGMRIDFRYFRTFDDLEILGVTLAESPGKVDFTRTSLGFIVRF